MFYLPDYAQNAAKICVDTESNIDYGKNFKNIDFEITNVADALSHSSVNAAIDLKSKAMAIKNMIR